MDHYLRAIFFSFYFICSFSFAFTNGSSNKGTNNNKMPEFRYDYTYNDEIDGWLKLHHVPDSWKEAKTRCIREGGELATPLDRPLRKAMMDTMRDQIYQGVFIAVHSKFSYGDYYSLKGIPVGRMPVSWTQWGPSADHAKQCVVFFHNGTITNDYCNASYPYMCYKRNNNETLSTCGTIDKEYIHVPDLDACYKVHTRKTTWRDAFMTCSAEGSHLLVINSEKERQSVVSMRPDVSVFVDNVHVGVVDLDGTREWTTIHDDKLEESGFLKWSPGEPNNMNNDEFCVTLFRGEGYNDAHCDLTFPFVCEKKIDSLITKRKYIVNIKKFYRK